LPGRGYRAPLAETVASEVYDLETMAIRFDPAPPDWVQPVTLEGSIVRL